MIGVAASPPGLPDVPPPAGRPRPGASGVLARARRAGIRVPHGFASPARYPRVVGHGFAG